MGRIPVSFNRQKLSIKPIDERVHDLDLGIIKDLERTSKSFDSIGDIANRVIEAKRNGSEIILMIGAHVIRSGVQKYLIDLMEKGYITCLAMNGACVLHDFELALIGATTESVSNYIKTGQFGLWNEVSQINDIVNRAFKNDDSGLGEAVGKAIIEGDFPYKEYSILAACQRLDIPATVHIGIGYDINHEHPNFDGAAAGHTSYQDFLKFVDKVTGLEGGVLMNFGSAVMAPEVFLKALSMARNVSLQENRSIENFTVVVGDVKEIGADYRKEPLKKNPMYYFRPWKTMLVRTVAGKGRSYYLQGRHADTIPALWTAIKEKESNNE